MAQTGVVSWSQTAATNATADSNVNWAEGQAPSSVNDSARAEMASVAKFRDDNAGSLTTGGTSTAYTLTTNQVFSSLTVLNGQTLTVRFNATNGASPTLNVDTLGAKPIQIDSATAVGTGAITANSIWRLTYDNSVGAFIIQNYPQTINALTATTLTATTGTITNLTVGGTFTFTLPGKSLRYGEIINGTIVESNATNAVTFSLKTLAGADPSSSDPVLVCFRNSTKATGNYVYRSITAATSVTVSSGSTLGAVNATPFRVWVVLFDDAGTIRMGVINCVSGTNIYPLGQLPIASSTAEGGAGAADSAQVFYTGTAVTAKPYVILGYANYESGLSTAGSWNVDPNLELYGPGVPLPGQPIQSQSMTTTTDTASNSTTVYRATALTVSITPTSAANLVKLSSVGSITDTGGNAGNVLISFLRGATQIGPAINQLNANIAGSARYPAAIYHTDSPGTTSSTTYSVGIVAPSGATAGSFPSTSGGYMEATEIMA